MSGLSFKRHRFPGSIICQAVRWYFRFTLSIRDVEELMAERGIEVSREAIRCWVGAVSLTLKVLHFDGYKPLVEQAFYEATIV